MKYLAEELEWDPKYPVRNYKKMETCKHKHFTVFLKCKCSLTLGENSLDEIIEILLKEKERLRGRRVVVQL